jgi:SAM-dependent methyltransferase
MSQNSIDQNACAAACVVTGNYAPQAKLFYEYLRVNNPGLRYIALVIGECESLTGNLPTGPEWIFWEQLFSKQERLELASRYTAFELSCVARGRLHEYLWNEDNITMWVILDTDMIVLSSLWPLWRDLKDYSGILTPHLRGPTKAGEREINSLAAGIYNAGFVAFRRCNESLEAIKWLKDRLENYGYASQQRREMGLKDPIGILFVDQLWLNFLPSYFPGILGMGLPEWNLGHWNLRDGTLTKALGSNEYFYDGRLVMIAHLSGIPKENPEYVSTYAPWYREFPNHVWAELAKDYIVKLGEASKASLEIGYCYSDLAPDTRQSKKARVEEKPASPVSFIPTKSFPKIVLQKVTGGLKSPSKIVGGVKLLSWQVTRSFQIAQAILINRGEDRIFQDQSENGFTSLIPCIGNYETYMVRASILQAVMQAKEQFHGKLLDVGAGSSPYEELIMASGKVSEYIKLDFASSDYHQGHELDLTWDGKTIPLNAASIDTVFMTEVLEHAHKPVELLREVRRVLKPGGILFMTVPFTWPMHELPFDYHRFTPIALRAYLEEAGFDVKGIQLLGGWDHSLALQIGLWLTNSSMGERKRKIAKILAWPFYSYLMRKGNHEYTENRNHQMHIGLAAIAKVSQL